MLLEDLLTELQKIKQQAIDQYDRLMLENRPDLAEFVDFNPEIYFDCFMKVKDWENKYNLKSPEDSKFVYVGAYKDVKIEYSEDGCLLIINGFHEDKNEKTKN